jgi:hypothetical protein
MQELPLRLGLAALGHHAVVVVVGQPLDDAAVDLDLARPQALQVGQ